MRGFIRGIAGSLFISLFLLLLIVTTAKLYILNSDNLTTLFRENNAYSRIEGEISAEIRKNVRPPFTSEQLSQLPPDLRNQYNQELDSIYNAFTEERVQALLENNIERIVAFVGGEGETLYLYAPIHEWGLPETVTSVEPLSQLSESTDIREILYYYTAGTGQEAQFDIFLKNIQAIGSSVNQAWIVLLIVEILLLGIVVWLGNFHRGIRGLGTLFLLIAVYVGIATMVMSFGNSTIQNGLIGSNPNLGGRIIDILVPPLLSQIIRLWMMVAIGSGIIGVGLFVSSFVINRKLLKSVEQPSAKKEPVFSATEKVPASPVEKVS